MAALPSPALSDPAFLAKPRAPQYVEAVQWILQMVLPLDAEAVFNIPGAKIGWRESSDAGFA